MKINITRENILGFLIGIASPFVFLPVVLLVLAFMQDTSVAFLWEQFKISDIHRSKDLSLGLISNLIWFYMFLNTDKYPYVRGIILGMFCYVPYMIYVNLMM
jgi:hypothetical protein